MCTYKCIFSSFPLGMPSKWVRRRHFFFFITRESHRREGENGKIILKFPLVSALSLSRVDDKILMYAMYVHVCMPLFFPASKIMNILTHTRSFTHTDKLFGENISNWWQFTACMARGSTVFWCLIFILNRWMNLCEFITYENVRVTGAEGGILWNIHMCS